MSITQRAKQGFLRLPAVKKAILLSSAALMISAIMPWYDNRNSFGVGETFLGVQGPLFLVGALVMAFGAISFFNMFFPLLGRNFFKLKRKSGVTAMILGAQSLFLLVVANSVFFHPSFGTNVSHKATRFGMVIAFASIGIMLISGWVTYRREKAGKFEDIEDFMTNPTTDVFEPANQNLSSSGLGYSPSRATTATLARPNGAYGGGVNSSNKPSVSSSAVGAVGAPDGVDPLTIDAKTRYKMIRSQARYSGNAKRNLWGGGQGSAFGKLNQVEADAKGEASQQDLSDNMRIRMDL